MKDRLLHKIVPKGVCGSCGHLHCDFNSAQWICDILDEITFDFTNEGEQFWWGCDLWENPFLCLTERMWRNKSLKGGSNASII